jgi:hypothetical protein
MIVGDVSQSMVSLLPRYPVGVPDRWALRARVMFGTAPTALRDELLATNATALTVASAFVSAFRLRLDDIDDVASWDRRISKNRSWRWAFELRDAHARGGAVVDLMHVQRVAGANSGDLGHALDDAFELLSRDRKKLLDYACRREPSFDAELVRAIERARAYREGSEPIAADRERRCPTR